MKMPTDQSFEQVNSHAVDPADVGSRLDPVLARSWLLVNGAHADRFEAAARSRADVVVLDIEDAVAPKDKDAARDNVVRWLDAGNSDWVRINGFGTPWWADDLAALAGGSVGGVMLAMVESVDHVTETAKRLPNVPIVALVEGSRSRQRNRWPDHRFQRVEADRGDGRLRRIRHDGQDLPFARPVCGGERGTIPVAGRNRLGEGVFRRVRA
jgi:hypothetical protein